MFTGLITGLGTIREVTPIGESRDARFAIGYAPDWPGRAGLSLGASIACSGCCLTVVDFDSEQFTVEVSAESLGVTTLGRWRTGPASTWSRRCGWATSWAAIWSPAMSMEWRRCGR